MSVLLTVIALAAAEPARRLEVLAPTGGQRSFDPLIEALTIYLADVAVLELHPVADNADVARRLASRTDGLVLGCSFDEAGRFVAELREGADVVRFTADWPRESGRSAFRDVALRVRSALRLLHGLPVEPPAETPAAPPAAQVEATPVARAGPVRIGVRLGAEVQGTPAGLLPAARLEVAFAWPALAVALIGGATWPARSTVTTGSGSTSRGVAGLELSVFPFRFARERVVPFVAVAAAVAVLDVTGTRTDTLERSHQIVLVPVIETGAGVRWHLTPAWYVGGQVTVALFPIDAALDVLGATIYRTGRAQVRFDVSLGFAF